MGYFDDVGNGINNIAGNTGLSEAATGIFPGLAPWAGANIFTKGGPSVGYNQADIENKVKDENTKFFQDPRMQNFLPFIHQGSTALKNYSDELGKNPIEQMTNYTQNYQSSPLYSLLSSKSTPDNPLMGNYTKNLLSQNAAGNANQMMNFRNQNLGNLAGMYNMGSKAAQDYLNSAMAKANASGQQDINLAQQDYQNKMNQYQAGQGFGGALGTLGTLGFSFL